MKTITMTEEQFTTLLAQLELIEIKVTDTNIKLREIETRLKNIQRQMSNGVLAEDYL